jgi:hypothetical protein
VSYAFVGILIVALVVGFIAGFALFRRSQQWCPGCGSALRCMRCAGYPTTHGSGESAGARR